MGDIFPYIFTAYMGARSKNVNAMQATKIRSTALPLHFSFGGFILFLLFLLVQNTNEHLSLRLGQNLVFIFFFSLLLLLLLHLHKLKFSNKVELFNLIDLHFK